MKKHICLFFLCVCLGTIVNAQDTVSLNKKGYNFINPTPRQKMREMETDRPDITESAYTVDAGHFQYEADIFRSVKTKEEDFTITENSYNVGNLKFGITNTLDLHVIVESYRSYRIKDNTGKISTSSGGFGDITARIKKNIWGNDYGKTAFAVMPYITFPTATKSENKHIEGGIVFPFSIDLNNDWELGMQLQVDLLRNDWNKKYHASILNSFVINKGITDKFNFFAESYYDYDFANEEFGIYINGGPSYSISKNFKLDAGVNIGLEKGSDKVYFAGFSFRY
ncbi:transporter [Rubrolithibacter danxiaensis]|uniref:transporter n=1 Tax=Rubrolithibacter danxiaensis TaxID=3390805 RepID=UPI003BF89B20